MEEGRIAKKYWQSNIHTNESGNEALAYYDQYKHSKKQSKGQRSMKTSYVLMDKIKIFL